ncbi:hypothetical protein K435DRAFT_779496 [Dendrothele bispora CBS 962.96]|uniref:Uncharacterized protein n=1 Tax=Dendrothele bispora (strain CBS 962.96) TaxID=1314807 RepID=A0A4S8LX45_DENBC|nr:hypothetical protein K435DRAFT_779496 [Dendrothele bispora CBS 962.96]
MRIQPPPETVEYYTSLPREVKEAFVNISSNYPAHLYPPGLTPITSVEEFDRRMREPYDIHAPEIEPQPDAIETYLPHLGFGIRYWVSHSVGKDGYYNFDFIDKSGNRINTPRGIQLFMDPNVRLKSTADIELARKLDDPSSYGIDPNATLPPACEIFIIYCGRPHILRLDGKEVYRFQTPEIPGRIKIF